MHRHKEHAADDDAETKQENEVSDPKLRRSGREIFDASSQTCPIRED
jgi:hypothetical protein